MHRGSTGRGTRTSRSNTGWGRTYTYRQSCWRNEGLMNQDMDRPKAWSHLFHRTSVLRSVFCAWPGEGKIYAEQDGGSLEPRTSDRVLVLGEGILGELDRVLDLVEGFQGKLELKHVLVIVELFCLLVQQLCVQVIDSCRTDLPMSRDSTSCCSVVERTRPAQGHHKLQYNRHVQEQYSFWVLAFGIPLMTSCLLYCCRAWCWCVITAVVSSLEFLL